jgi:predicted DNA-binding protein
MNRFISDVFITPEMLTPIGRPYKFGEPTVRREVRLPQSLNERLTEYSRKNGEDVSDVVRNAVDDVISGKRESEQNLIDPQAVRLALADALREEKQKDVFTVRLPESDRERVKDLADAIGYSEPQHLIEDVMKNLLRRPEEIQELLLGRAIRDLQAALLAEGKADIAKGGTLAKKRLAEKVQAVKNDEKKAATPRKKKVA